MLVLLFSSHIHGGDHADDSGSNSSPIHTITHMDELKQILDESGDHLLMFDLYADWCMPCRMLAPKIKKIAAQHSDKVTVYKIDVDATPDVASAFGARGIPYIVFVKEKKAVEAFAGVRPKETYVRTIERFTHAADST
jgi:thioredoxin